MPTAVEVSLDEPLYDELAFIAEEKGTSIPSVISDLLRKHLWEVKRPKIMAELAEYDNMYASIREQYFGLYVGIHDGQVVDHGSDSEALCSRLQERFGRTPVLVVLVGENEIKEKRKG